MSNIQIGEATGSRINPPVNQAVNVRPYLGYLDGIRGMAALYVFIGHFAGEIAGKAGVHQMPVALSLFCRIFGWGHFAVSVFIVLSGYVLMLPIVKSRELRGGIGSYFIRRARRILPPYYAAIFLSLLIIGMVPGLRSGVGFIGWDSCLPAFKADVIVTHLLLIHNWYWDTVYKINGPAWTVATEWQIYFLLPFVFLPLWRKMGIAGLIISGIILGYAPHFIFNRYYEMACPHYIALFALGMAGAAITHGEVNKRVHKMPWGMGSLFFLTLSILSTIKGADWVHHHYYIIDAVVGLSAMCLIVYGAGRTDRLRFFNSNPVAALGAFSYSLYLIHFPIIGAIDHYLIRAHTPFLPSAIVLILCMIPVVGFAYLFHLAFEKPFLTTSKRIPAQDVTA